MPSDALHLFARTHCGSPPRSTGRSAWRCTLFFCAVALSLVLSGCRHKPVRSPLPIGVLAPVDLETPPAQDNPPMIADMPPPELGPLPSAPPPSPPRRRASATPKENEPTQLANNDAAAALAIGALSAGGDDASHTAQQVQDLINSVLKRVSALSSQVAAAQRREVRQVRNFLDQSQKALKSGDAEGAHTLATKANLLMDDVEKK
jgi:hypothetical protein